jgi:urease accessory protein UreH
VRRVVSTIQTGTAARAAITAEAAAKAYAAGSGHEDQHTDAEKGLADYEKHHKVSSA